MHDEDNDMLNNSRSFSIVFACVGSLVSFSVYADRVEGTVEPIPEDNLFTVQDAQGKPIKIVNVNERGEYTVYLRPGLYRVVSLSGSATIRSEAIPLYNQQITFK